MAIKDFFKRLFIAYREHVGSCEGIDFLDPPDGYRGQEGRRVYFADDDWDGIAKALGVERFPCS